MYAGTKTHPFSPSTLYISTTTGRLYHPLPPNLDLPPIWMLKVEYSSREGGEQKIPPLGLMKSSLVLSRLYDLIDVGKGSVRWDEREYALRIVD